MCRVPIIFRFTVVVELRALATRCPCRSRVHHRRGAASTCVANAPIWVSHAKSHRLQHCRAPVQALVSQRVQRTRTSELMGRLAEAFCEHLMHGAAAARMSACMAKPARTSSPAALSARQKRDRNYTETIQKLYRNYTETFQKMHVGFGHGGGVATVMWASDTEGGSAVACVCICGLRTRRGGRDRYVRNFYEDRSS